MTQKPTIEPTFRITVEGQFDLEARYFFDDSLTEEHADALAEDLAAEVARYVEAHGLRTWLREWNLDEINVRVDHAVAVSAGIAVLSEDSGTRPGPEYEGGR